MNSNFYFLLRREPLHSMVCMLSWWWAPWILWKDRGWKNSSEHCYFTSDENTFLIRICASQGLMRYSPLILINLIALLMVCSSSSLALIYWRKPSNDDKWAIILENVHHQRHILLCWRNTKRAMIPISHISWKHAYAILWLLWMQHCSLSSLIINIFCFDFQLGQNVHH